MAHITKFSIKEINGLTNHIDRKSKKHKNENIDINKKDLNERINFKDGLSTKERFKKRFNQLEHSSRKDLKVLAGIVITMPKTLDKKYEKQFFNECAKFISADFGKENIIYGVVHNDETTPHIHIGAIPTVIDNNGVEKVCAKEKLNKDYFKNFHDRLQTHLENALQVKVDIQSEIKNEKKNLSIEDLKLKSVIENKQLKLDNLILKKENQELKNKVNNLQDELFKEKYENKKIYQYNENKREH